MKTFSYGSPFLRAILILAVLVQTSCKKSHHDPVVRVSSLAGSGDYGFADGSAATAKFDYPSNVAVDGQGNIFVADPYNNRVRKISPSGEVSTLAGTGTAGLVNGPRNTAQFNMPYGVACDAQNNIYVLEMYNHCIRKITPAGMVSTLAGTGTAGYVDGPGISAKFDNPTGLAIDVNGNLYVADQGQNKIRKVTPSGVVSTLAGSTVGYNDGIGTAAQFHGCYGVACDAQANVYVADRSNHCIRKITQAGEVATLAGLGAPGSEDGNRSEATFNGPTGVAVDAAGNVYVADANNYRIRKITPGGVVSTYAGSVNGFADGVGLMAQFNLPYGVACDRQGNVYVADYLNSKVRKITFQ